MQRGKTPKFVKITDHARVRFMERRMGMDIEAIDKEIIKNGFGGQRRKIANGRYSIGEGCRAVVYCNTVVTIDGGFHTTGPKD
jgi:hypothetical protein